MVMQSVVMAQLFGGGGGGAGGSGSTAGTLLSLIPFALIFIIFYFLVILPQQKRSKKQKALLEALKKGDQSVAMQPRYLFGAYFFIDELRLNA